MGCQGLASLALELGGPSGSGWEEYRESRLLTMGVEEPEEKAERRKNKKLWCHSVRAEVHLTVRLCGILPE